MCDLNLLKTLVNTKRKNLRKMILKTVKTSKIDIFRQFLNMRAQLVEANRIVDNILHSPCSLV
jgi:hypothetical protein